jgi:hypothetical protein
VAISAIFLVEFHDGGLDDLVALLWMVTRCNRRIRCTPISASTRGKKAALQLFALSPRCSSRLIWIIGKPPHGQTAGDQVGSASARKACSRTPGLRHVVELVAVEVEAAHHERQSRRPRWRRLSRFDFRLWVISQSFS